MPDLDLQIRALIDSVPPVTAREAIDRSSARGGAPGRRSPSVRGPVAVAASVLLIAAAAGWVAASGEGQSHRHRNVAAAPIDAADVSDILTASSSAMASSGMAHVVQTTYQNGHLQSTDTGTVTFDGQNIDEHDVIASPGSNSFSVDDRLVDGQFYIYTAGPTGSVEWIHDTGSDSTTSMAFPDPRSFYAQIDSQADFEVVGTSTHNGTTLSELAARRPGAIASAALAPLAQGALTSFVMWVDPDDVVQQLTFASSSTFEACTFGPKDLEDKGGVKTVTTTPAQNRASARCGPQTTQQSATVTYSGLGGDETVVAPSHALDVVGHG